MPTFESSTAGRISNDLTQGSASASNGRDVSFAVTRDHILNCSYDSWFPKYRTSAIKSRIIRLSPEFVEYIREDGIILADDEESAEADEEEEWQPDGATEARMNSSENADSDSDSEPDIENNLPPNARFPEIHQEIKDKILELGGAVAPKLNWSSPKDATWISAKQNTLKCTSPNDIYLLLKSSSFVSHDLEHAFDGTVGSTSSRPFHPVLVLRPFFSPHLAFEFRCFVKQRTLVGLCQRDWNRYEFLQNYRSAIVAKVGDFFEKKLRFTFPDGNFVFDVYLPEDGTSVDRLGRVRLIDINPWASTTDSLLFNWDELLSWKVPQPMLGSVVNEEPAEVSSAEETTDDDDVDELVPELRLVEKDSAVCAPQYSAHKMPKEVVDASMGGQGGIAEFAARWRELTEGRGGDIWEPNA